MGQIMKLRLSCYLVLLSTEAKPGNKTAAVPRPDPYDIIEKWIYKYIAFFHIFQVYHLSAVTK